MNRDDAKKEIIDRFNHNVRGKNVPSQNNHGHDGHAGHWLETLMSVRHNGNNAPDLFGFEMKDNTTSKTTFGDWSPDMAIFKGRDRICTRDEFLHIFGSPNPNKNNRYSWSGKPCPKINVYNSFGQKLHVDMENNIIVLYNYKDDQRENKADIIPVFFKDGEIVLAKWTNDKIKQKVERKFNQLGWFKCKKNNDGFYNEIVFGEPFNFNTWIEDVKNGLIFFDSGMYEGNVRPYSQWRANNSYWDSKITERY